MFAAFVVTIDNTVRTCKDFVLQCLILLFYTMEEEHARLGKFCKITVLKLGFRSLPFMLWIICLVKFYGLRVQKKASCMGRHCWMLSFLLVCFRRKGYRNSSRALKTMLLYLSNGRTCVGVLLQFMMHYWFIRHLKIHAFRRNHNIIKSRSTLSILS